MEKIKAIFIDFDWTLFDYNKKEIPQSTLKALALAHKNGVKLIINSARSYYSLDNTENDDVLIIAGRYSGFPLFKCEFTKKFGVAQIELATKEGSTNVILLAVTGGNIVNNGVETSPFITMAFAD